MGSQTTKIATSKSYLISVSFQIVVVYFVFLKSETWKYEAQTSQARLTPKLTEIGLVECAPIS